MKKHSRRWHALFWSALALGVVVVLVALAILVPNLMIIQGAKPYIVESPEAAPHAQCAIILGARIYEDGTPYPMLVDRLETGIKLYQLGKVDNLLLSGEHNQVPYNQVDVMLQYVLARGVPAQDVFTDYSGLDTYDTMYRALNVFQVKTALIVTQDFHLSRSVYIARHLGLDVTGVDSDIQIYTDEGVNSAREVLARVKAVLQLYITHPGAPGLQGPFPITGDGRASR